MHPAFQPGNTAVITGGASGIGLAIARKLAGKAMNVVLVDLNEAALVESSKEISDLAAGGQVLVKVADVSSLDAMKRVADDVRSSFGAVDVLVNNAAITDRGGPWGDLEAWRRCLDINLWGVLHGHAAFVPGMIAAGRACAVVNLGSKEGITTPPGNAAYSVSKAAIKVLTEQLAHELRQLPGAQITAHLLVPGFTFTPMNFRGMTATASKPPAPWTADQVADALLEGVDAGQFYIICPDNEVSSELDRKRIEWAAQDMIAGRPALSRWHPEYRTQFETFARAG